MLNIVTENMSEHYKAIGWNFTEKYDEIATTEYFLIIEDIGFLSFRDDYSDDDRDVTYIYEIQIKKGNTGRGLGKLLIKKLEEVVRNKIIDDLPFLIMCTVAKNNTGSFNFFKKYGFKIDRESPKDALYWIMSKQL